jgi:hypothetical protein
MDAETAKSVRGLMDLFGQRDGSIILERLTRYVTIFRNTNGSTFPEVTIIAVINSILWYIEMYNPTKQQDDPVMNAGNLAYNRIIRIYYIRTIFMNQDEKTGVGLFNIIAECLSNNDNSTEISVAIDRFITSTGLRPSPTLLLDAKEAYRVAEGIARGRGQDEIVGTDRDTLGAHLGRGPGPIPPDPLQHTFGNVDNPLRERILEIEKERRDVIVDLNDPATKIAVFDRLNETGHPFYSQQEVMDEINQIVTERRGLPPPVTFPPGNFTPIQQRVRGEAIDLGWRYGMGKIEKPEFFSKPGGAAAAPDNRGGNKRIKSKRISKMRYKKSKKRSNRRRRRYSYKKQ